MKNVFFTLLCLSFFAAVFAQPSGQRDTMRSDTQRLADVVIKGKKPLFQQVTGGMVVNLESSMLTKGSSALDALEKSPGIIIDHRSNSIILNGKPGVMVMINGKLIRMPQEQLLTMLNGMSADNLEKIELLTTPPANYDAEGSAGVINIVIKKIKKQGTNGNFSITGGYGLTEKGAGNINLDHNNGKTGLYGSYSFSHDRSYGILIGNGSENVAVLGGQTAFDFRGEDRYTDNNHNIILGLDTKLTPRTTVGGSINFSNSHAPSTATNYTKYTRPADSILLFNGTVTGNNKWTNLISSVCLEKKIREGEQLNIDLDWLWYKNDNPTEVKSTFLDQNGTEAGTDKDSLFSPRQNGFAHTTIGVGVAKMDYTRRLSKNIKLESGVKGSYTNSSSLSGIQSLINGAWVASLGTTNYIDMKEGIGAVYGSINAQINEATSLVIGGRYEYSHTHMKDANNGKSIVDRRLGAFFPNISFSRKLNDHAELQLSYSKRISRPSYTDLASFITYNDPISVLTGNPLLKPAITNNLKLGYNYKGYAFSILLSRDDHSIVRYQLTANPAGNLVLISPQNMTWQNNLNFQANLPFKIGNWWTMNYSVEGGLRQFKVDYTLQPVEKTYFGYSLNFSESVRLPKNFSAEISGWYNSKGYYGSTKGPGMGSLNMGLKKELKNNGGSLQLSVTDLLMTIHYRSYIGALTEEVYSTKANVTYTPESGKFPIFRLSWSKSFGNDKSKSERKQSAGAVEERDRVRK